jgi:hypothetical protein
MGPFPLLTDDLLDTSRQNFDFTQSLTDTLGDLGTPQDGFDAYLADTISILLASGPIGILIDGDLGTAASIAGLINPNSLDDVTAALPGYLAEGDAIVTDASALLEAITGAPTPPTSGGGGGGGASSCVTQDFGTVPSGTTKTIQLNISNNGSVSITVKGLVVAGVNGPNIFSISNMYQGKVLAPGASVPLTINCSAIAAPAAQYTSTLTVNTNQPDPQPCMTLTANVTAPTGGGGTGTGGGGGTGNDGPHCDVGFDDKGHLVCLD